MENINANLNTNKDIQNPSNNEINQKLNSINQEEINDNSNIPISKEQTQQTSSSKVEETKNPNDNNKNSSQKENKKLISENSKKKEEEKNKDEFIFNFDKIKISPSVIDNMDKQEESQILKIFYKNQSTISINSDSLIIQKISSKLEMQSSMEIPFQSYEDNFLLSVSKNPSLGKISLSSENTDDYEKISRIYEKNKNINLAANSENDIICQKPTIIPEKKENVNFTFQEMMNCKNALYEKSFTIDSKLSQKLKINNENYIKDIFSLNNPIFVSYAKKNIRIFEINKKDEEKKVKLILNKENEEDNTISANNERRKKKEKFTYKFQKPNNTDNNKNDIACIDLDIFEKIEQNYDKSYIKSFIIQKNTKSQKLNIENDTDNFITEIYYSYKPNEKKSPKINLDTNNFLEGKLIEDINKEYINKNIMNIDLYNNYFEKNDIDVFDNIDFDNINKQYEKYKKSRTKKKDKYLYSGNASLQLIKDSLSQEIYNNSETNVLYKLSTQLKDIDDINDNDEIKKIRYNSDNLALNNKNLKCAKKLKNEFNRSLMNKYIHNNKSEIFYSYNPRISNNSNSKDINSIKSEDNIKKDNNYYKKIMKKINKINDNVNEKEKKIYNNKLKFQQENKIEKEIKKEKKYKYIIPALFFLVLLFNKFYNIYISK